MAHPTLYVIAGPNGIGKTTSTYNIIPRGIPIINSDEIAKQVKLAGIAKVNTQEYSNREAMKLIDEHMQQQTSFAMETNLADEETWKFLAGIKQKGYKLHLIFMCTDNVELLNQRISERVERGEHYVRPDIVEQRYITGLKLLKHYFKIPDRIQLIDNSDEVIVVADKFDQYLEANISPLPNWVEQYLASHQKPSSEEKDSKEQTVDDIRKKYHEKLKDKK